MAQNWQPQKCLHLSKELAKKTPKIVGEYLITTKFEGWYVVIPYLKNLGWQTPQSFNNASSSFRDVPSLLWTRYELSKLPTPDWNCYLIVEGLVPDTTFEKTNGLLNRKESCLGVRFYAHDIIVPSLPALTGLERWNLLQSFEVEKSGLVEKIPLLLVSSFNQLAWENLAANRIAKGEEGIVMKSASVPYQVGKRNATLLKLKMEFEKDLQVVNLELTKGKKGNTGYTLVSKGKNGVEVRTVINGHADQRYFEGLSFSELQSKVVLVKGMRELEDGNIKEPVFVRVREDKHIADID